MSYKPPKIAEKKGPAIPSSSALDNTHRMFDMLKSGMQIDAAHTLKAMR